MLNHEVLLAAGRGNTGGNGGGVLGGLFGNNITKTIVPASTICPAPMPLHNSWVAPTNTPATGG